MLKEWEEKKVRKTEDSTDTAILQILQMTQVKHTKMRGEIEQGVLLCVFLSPSLHQLVASLTKSTTLLSGSHR